jgi:hypothetical protein
VRFGDSSGQLDRRSLSRLKPLPSAEDPVLVYLGLTKDTKRAIFLVDATVNAVGDGECDPSPADCETISLREGETEFFDVLDDQGKATAQYELDLVKIRRSTTASAAKAKAALSKVSPAGRKLLRAHKAEAGPLRYRYDRKAGTLRRLGAKAYKAAVARSARAAMAIAGGFDIER